jgi:5,10-methylenetetrahydromethanopterin reductase
MTRGLTTGVALQGRYPPEEFEVMVRLAEESGLDHLWMTDSSLHTRNPYVHLALAARITTRMTLGTAVTNPQTRHPGIVAVNAATLEELAPERTILGIGAGDRPLRALGLRPAHLAELRASIDAIRRLLAGEHVDSDGPGFRMADAHLRFATNPGIPVYISASGPKTLALAGEIADGVIFLGGLFADGVAYGLENIMRGAERAGRPRPHVAAFGYGAIDDEEPERALEAARSIAAWFPQTAPHYCELAGLDPEIAEEVRSRYGGGEFQEAQVAASILPTEFVRKMAFAGDSALARQHLETLQGLGVDSVHLFPLGERRRQTLEAFAALVADCRAPSSTRKVR